MVYRQQARFKSEARYNNSRVLCANVGFYDIQYDDHRPKVRLSWLALAMSLKQRDPMLDNLKVPRAVFLATVLNSKLHKLVSHTLLTSPLCSGVFLPNNL